MTEILPRFDLPSSLPRRDADLDAPTFHHALDDVRGPDVRDGGRGTRGIGLGGTGPMFTNFLGFGAPGPGAPGFGAPRGSGAPAPGAPAGGAGGTGGTAGFGASKPVLSKGSKGADVQTAETQINGWRADNGRTPIKADGKYDQQTETAVRDFQKTNKMDVDGSIGANTHDRLQLENDASFKTIDPATKTLVRDQLNANADNQAGRESMLQLGTDPNLAKLPADAQQSYVKKLAAKPADLSQIRDDVKARATLETDSNFQKLDAVTQKSVREKMERYDGRPVERDLLQKLATDPNFGKLDGAANRDRALKALGNNPASAANLTNLQKTIGSDTFQNKTDGASRAKILDLAAAHAGDGRYSQDLAKLASDPRFGALNPAEKVKTLDVFDKTTADGRKALQDLLQRDVNGVSALKSHGIAKDSPPLLDTLHRLTNAPSTDARMRDGANGRVSPAQYSEYLLQEISSPDNYIDQSNRGTCTATSISHKLAAKNPAEYARLATDLALTGQSKLANGAAINVPADAWAKDSSTRSHSERLLQSSLMSYGRPGKTYINARTRGPGVDGWADKPNSGLQAHEQTRVMEGLYNKPFESFNGYGLIPSRSETVTKIRGELAKGVTHVNVDVKWGSGSHAIEVTKIANGRVYIRNPHGPAGVGATGTNQGTAGNDSNNGPLRTTEDGSKAIQSMSLADFEKAILYTYVDG